MSKKLLIKPGGSPRRAGAFSLLILCVALAVVPTGRLAAQGANQLRITIDVTGQPMARVIEQVHTQSGYEFVFNSVDVGSQPNVTLRLDAVPLREALDAIFRESNLVWAIENRTVTIRRAAAQPGQTMMTGTVRDTDGTPVAGASVIVKGTTRGVATGPDGRFAIAMQGAGEHILVISFLGMETQETVWQGQPLNVVMQATSQDIEMVVVRGNVRVRDESQAGSSATFNREELRRVGNSNVIRSLSNLDPSFHIVENLADGSNPNAMPEIRLRGQSGFPDLRGEYISNPNQPLFILDGFEANLTKVMDMDMDRVESVTILKDAAATALYGSRAGNGVVVIETRRPQAGELRFSYTGSLNVQAPDLRSYNLTDAAEKLRVEKEAGRYTNTNNDNPHEQYDLDLKYNAILEEVMRGVDTYWLSKPLRTGIGHKHALYLEGGTETFTYGLDFSYNNVTGVMKGSHRNTIAGGVTIGYRYKNLVIRNILDIAYNRGDESPYGTFREYADMNPYYRATNERGEIVKILDNDPATGPIVTNPLWNSTLNTVDFSEYSQFTENLEVEWRSDFGLSARMRGSISRTDNGNELFRPSSHTDFASYTEEDMGRRGRYTYDDGMSFRLAADANVNYTKFFGSHYISAYVGWTLNESTSRNVSFLAEGFTSNYIEDITFARQYPRTGSPTGSESTTRSVGFYSTVNYSYEDRYLFEGSIRVSGSSQFGRNNPWGQFWSLGAGWNLHKEKFMENVRFVDRLKVRGSVGFTGSEEFSSYQSLATYAFNTNSNPYLGEYGAFLLGIENPDLRWQRKFEKGVGADIEMFDRKLVATFDYYSFNTEDLLTDVTIAPSTGFNSYKANIGQTRNRGFDGRISYRVWNDVERQNYLNVSVGFSHNVNKVRKISNALAAYNEEQVAAMDNRPKVMFVEGQSLNAIWAMPSYGIDPASGREIFVRPDGTVTFDYHPEYLAVCGDTEPKLSGIMGINANYEGFSLNVTMNYRFGGQIYNQTVVDRVENANISNNVDRRVFSDRWYAEGDTSWFRTIRNAARSPSTTRATQRFVQDLDEWSISSVNLSYDLDRALPVDRIGVKRLRLAFDMADVARLSSVKIERGTDYPFARSFSFSLQANF